MSSSSYTSVIRLTVLLCIGALFCCRIGNLKLSPTLRRELQGSAGEDKPQEKEYYQNSALNFLIKHGIHYRLFDLFFSSELGSKPVLKQNPKFLNGTYFHAKAVSDDYKIKTHKNAKTYGVATAEVQPEMALLNYTYTLKPSTDEMNLYNNKFRYGPNIDDRFMTIVFDKDPVEEATKESPTYIFFVGVNTELSQSYNYVCNFTALNVQSKVEITRKLRNVVNRETQNSLIRCAVPWSVSSALTKASTEVVLDLVREPATPGEAALSLLSDIRVPRLHALDRRSYRYVVQTMLEVLDDAMVVEWVVYNILLGVEHFYFYYNAKSADLDLEHSLLKPFLDANIVTLIYFPFLHTVHFNNVQHAALNAYLHQFGRYTEFVGFWDIDEFFLPTSTRLPYLNNQTYTMPVLDGVVMPLAADTNVPAIIFNTLDMDCDAQAGDDAIHRGVTTHCLRTGFLFEEYSRSHGKMIVRPARTTYIMSPHRMNQRSVQWTDDWQGGMFRHFNQFRYTSNLIASGEFSEDKIGSDESLRNFTLKSLKDLLGITLKK